MERRIPTKAGDVLILRTSTSFTTFAVGPVLTDGQQGFDGSADVKYLNDSAPAVLEARARVRPGGQIYTVDIDSGEWSPL